MEVKKACSECKIEKSLNEFHKNNTKKSGHQSSCNICTNIRAKEYRRKYASLETREEKDKKVCYHCKIEKNILEFSKDRYRKDGVQNACRDCRYKRNNAYSKARKQYDPEFKLLINMRSRLGRVLRGNSKSQTTKQLIGLDFEIFTKWIEFQFEEGMALQNYGSIWHLDHVLPISSFNLLEEEELHKAMNWKNIRPLPPVKNIKKSNKIDPWLY